MIVLSAQYVEDSIGNTVGINAVIDSENVNVPIDPANRHYAEIMRQVEAGTLTIIEAE